MAEALVDYKTLNGHFPDHEPNALLAENRKFSTDAFGRPVAVRAKMTNVHWFPATHWVHRARSSANAALIRPRWVKA